MEVAVVTEGSVAFLAPCRQRPFVTGNMTFERHVSISYAHIDNQPLTPEQKGWVTLLHGTLQTMLSQRIGGQADIWRDEKVRGNDIFSNEIVDQLLKIAHVDAWAHRSPLLYVKGHYLRRR